MSNRPTTCRFVHVSEEMERRLDTVWMKRELERRIGHDLARQVQIETSSKSCYEGEDYVVTFPESDREQVEAALIAIEKVTEGFSLTD